MTGVKLYDELTNLAECVPIQRKHFNDEKGEFLLSVLYGIQPLATARQTVVLGAAYRHGILPSLCGREGSESSCWLPLADVN